MMVEEELRQALAESAEAARREPGVAGGVGNRRRVELLIDPGGEAREVVPAEGVERGDVARGRAEAEPGERQDRQGRRRQGRFLRRLRGSGAPHLAGRLDRRPRRAAGGGCAATERAGGRADDGADGAGARRSRTRDGSLMRMGTLLWGRDAAK